MHDNNYALSIDAKPEPVEFLLEKTAVIMIDMQRDFLQLGGFGESLGNDVSELRRCIAPCKRLLAAARKVGVMIIHTREGHRSNLSDVHEEKQARCAIGKKIGDLGPMGRILVRGEYGHDLIDELSAWPDEVVIDKPGKGAFYSTDLDLILRQQGISNLLICGVTTEVCVNSTVREANDRGYKVIVPGDCCGSYFPEFHRIGLEIISAQGGIFGCVTNAQALIQALEGALTE